MSGLPPSLRLAGRVLAAEGWRAFRDRALDRRIEARRRGSFRPADGPGDLTGGASVPVLILAATPPVPRLGGVQAQLLARLEAQSNDGAPWALLYPEADGYRLEVDAGGRRRSVVRMADRRSVPERLVDEPFERIVEEAAALVGARNLHVEGLAGQPVGSLLALASRRPTVLSLHDFAAFCPRPHLYEEPWQAFCGYCRDLERCLRCLSATWPGLPARFQAERRDVAAGLLSTAAAIVYPSDFLRRAHLELFAGLDPARQHVVAPALASKTPVCRRPAAVPPRIVAYVGSAKPHKGAAVFAEVVARLAPEFPGVRFRAYGGGDADLLSRFRRLGVAVRGYYRHGVLPELLAGDQVDLALLPSIVPESYGLTADECAAAGVPVLAFELGALGERLTRESLVPLAEGAAGMAERLRQVLAGRSASLPGLAPAAGHTPVAAAEAYGKILQLLDTSGSSSTLV